MSRSQSGDSTIFGFATLVLRRWRAFILLPLSCAAIAGALTLLKKREYATVTSFAPRSQDARSGLGAVAAQLGIAVPSTEASQSPDFFADLLRSPEILGAVADSGYVDGTRRVSLAGPLGVTATDSAVRRLYIVKALMLALTVDRNNKTSVVTTTVRAPEPHLTYQIAQALLREINEFNLRTRQERAAAEVKFVEQRLSVLRDELRASEERLLAFRISNRGALAPALEIQQQRLERDVTLRQQVFGALSQAYEQARIDAVRNTPVITVVQHPVVPVLPESRHLAMRLLLGILVGFLLFTVYLLVGNMLDVARDTDTEAYVRFRSLWPFRRARDLTSS